MNVGSPYDALNAPDTIDAASLDNSGTINLFGQAGPATLRTGAVTDSGTIYLGPTATLLDTGTFAQTAGRTQVDGTLDVARVTLTGGMLLGTGRRDHGAAAGSGDRGDGHGVLGGAGGLYSAGRDAPCG